MRGPRTCEACLRRSWLLGRLSACLDYRSRDLQRLIELLALGDEALIAATAGKRRDRLREEWASLEASETTITDLRAICRHDTTICRHDTAYPSGLASTNAPHMLHVAGGIDRLTELASAPTVAIVGSTRATDYGMEIAKSLARGLSASGVTVTSGLVDGIAVAAHAGALEIDGGAIAVMPGGLDVACPARWHGLYGSLRASGCAVAELPCGTRTRRWGQLAGERVLAGLGELTIVVEADDSPTELLSAGLAQSLGRIVAAVPGRVTSPVSRGTHRLLMEGASLVRGAEDVLELLGQATGMSRDQQPNAGEPSALAELEPRLSRTLEAVGAGRDTAAKLTAGEADGGETLLALSELELMGLIARGDGGRYVPRQSALATLTTQEPVSAHGAPVEGVGAESRR